jgi:MoxR-like ATPase
VAERQPVFIWGGPGVGKSAVVRQLAAELTVPLQDIRALLLDPGDLRGLPFLGKDGQTKWAAPGFLPHDGSGILFLDELNAAPAMVQASCYQLVLDRKLGEYTLPEGWAIVAAGNRDSYRAVTTRMPTPLRNRFVHLEFDVDLQEWSEWAIRAEVRPGGDCLSSFPSRVVESLRPRGQRLSLTALLGVRVADTQLQARPDG